MADQQRLRSILTDIQVTCARTDTRLQVVIDEQKDQKKDISTLKTQRSLIVGAYLALVATVGGWFTFTR